MVTLRQLFYEEGNNLSVLQLPGSKRFSRSLVYTLCPCYPYIRCLLTLCIKNKLTVASDYHMIYQPIIITCDLAIFNGER